MANNIIGGQPNAVVAKQTITFEKAGITAGNTAVIYEVGSPNKSYMPGRAINAISAFSKNKGYYIVALEDFDLLKWAAPPVVSGSQGVPLIWLNGESNSGGYALTSSATTGEKAPHSLVQILNNTSLEFEDLQITGTPNNLLGHYGLPNDGTRHGIELQLANRMEDGTFISPICNLVKTGQGGTTIAQLDQGGTWMEQSPWTLLNTRVDAAKAIINTATGKNPSLYMIYSQCINDAIAGTSTTAWKTATAAYFARLRAKYGMFPIWMTRFEPMPYAAYNTAIDELAASLENVFVVSTAGASLIDTNHFDYGGMKLVANRILDNMLEKYAI